MFDLSKDLQQLAARGRRISVGLVGTGQMGTDMVAQVSLMPSMDICVAADAEVQRAAKSFEIAGHPAGTVAVCDSLDRANRALLDGRFVATADYRLVTDAPRVQAVIEATGSPEVSSRVALRAIYQGKVVVMMSVEMDITIGPLLKWYADRHGVVYTLAAGDEPTALYELYDFATALGLEVVAAGKGKNNPLRKEAVPEDLADEAARRGLTPEMLVEFVDGSKTQIEMAAVANATGLRPDVRGMHGPSAKVAEFNKVFALKTDGGILEEKGVVEYVIGDLAPGVFLVFTTDHERLRQCLVLRDMGPGPYYSLVRPFHLCSMEVPLSVALAVVRGRATMTPGARLVAEVMCVAKQDLKAGRTLERIGGRTHHGEMERAEVAEAARALPLGIARGAVLKEDLPKGAVITYDHVALPTDQMVIELRRLQDEWCTGRIAENALLERLDALAVSDGDSHTK